MSKTLDQLISIAVKNRTPEELALGWIRYETVRKLTPHLFGEMSRRNLGGEIFDDMVTAAAEDWERERGGHFSGEQTTRTAASAPVGRGEKL